MRLEQDLPELSDDDGVLPFKDVLVGKCRVSLQKRSEHVPRNLLSSC